MRALLVLIALGGLARAQTTYESTVHARPRRDDAGASIVMTAAELQKRNVQTLADALELVPQLQVRQGGMGLRLDLRGARQQSILVLVDGVPIDEPYFGAFDLGAIPITDIVEIRVQLTPASPLEGPGGDGGVVEIFTLRAVGGRRLQARLVGGSEPEGEAALGGRLPLGKSWGVRASVGGRTAAPEYPVAGGARFTDREWQTYGGARLEHATLGGRFAVDAWFGHRAFTIPPSELTGTQLQDVLGEDAARLVIGGEARRGEWRIAAGGYGEILARSTDFFVDFTKANVISHQDLLSGRGGAALHVDRAIGRLGSLSARLSLDGEGARIAPSNAPAVTGFASFTELAIGTHLRWRWLLVDGAVGALVPFQHPENAWPEARVSVAVEPHRALSLALVGARKGRLPTLRELYDPSFGNPALEPEQTWHGEVRVQTRPHPLFAATVSAYLRQIEGFIRADPNIDAMPRRNLNLDTIQLRGLSATVDVARDRIAGGGIAYMFEDSNSPTLGFGAIPISPRHRVDLYLASNWRQRVGGLIRFRHVDERVVQGQLLPPYQLLDLTVWARIWREIRASLRIDNLLDNHYQQLPALRALGITARLTVEGAWQ